jgi:hypothetical protein
MNGWTGRWVTQNWAWRWWLSAFAPVREIGRLVASVARLTWRAAVTRLIWQGEVRKPGD